MYIVIVFLLPFRFRHGCFLIKHPGNVSSHPTRLNLAPGPSLPPHYIGNGVRSGCPAAARGLQMNETQNVFVRPHSISGAVQTSSRALAQAETCTHTHSHSVYGFKLIALFILKSLPTARRGSIIRNMYTVHTVYTRVARPERCALPQRGRADAVIIMHH